MLDGHGDDLHLIKDQIKYNFSSNVYYKGCPKPLLENLKKEISCIENYPSPSANELNTLAAEKYNLLENNFLFTNGATEAFYLIAHSARSRGAHKSLRFCVRPALRSSSCRMRLAPGPW